MAKSFSNKNTIVSYPALLTALKTNELSRVYYLHGEEDYLRNGYIDELRKKCLPEGVNGFNYHRLNGPKLDMGELKEACETMPFTAEYNYVEIWDFDINKSSDYDAKNFGNYLKDVPDYSVLVFIFTDSIVPDNRLSGVKALKSVAVEVEFTAQETDLTAKWIIAHFKSEGKNCDLSTARFLIEACGSRLSFLLPQIEKIAGFCKGESVSREDIDAVADKQLSFRVFDLSDSIGNGNYEKAAQILKELLNDPENDIGMDIYWISEQFRRMYIVKIAKGNETDIAECIPELKVNRFLIPKLCESAKKFSVSRLTRAMDYCVETDFQLRDSTGATKEEILTELILRLAVDSNDV